MKPPAEETPRALALVGHLAVVFDTGGSRAEHESVLLVVVGVENQYDVVALAHLRVTNSLPRHDAVRLTVERPDPHVQRFIIEQDADLGELGRRLPVVRFSLGESRHRRSSAPCHLVEHTADVRGGGHPHRGRESRSEPECTARGGGHLLLRREGRCGEKD